MANTHRACLIVEAERTCKRLGLSYIPVGINEWLIESKLCLTIKKMLEEVYRIEAGK